jgi:hypothetical protein
LIRWYTPGFKAEIPYDPNFSPTGYLPQFLDERDPRPAAEQFQANYPFGGWSPMQGWRLDVETLTIRYPGDPPFRPVAETRLRDERILLYRGAWVLVLQPSGSFEIARMD